MGIKTEKKAEIWGKDFCLCPPDLKRTPTENPQAALFADMTVSKSSLNETPLMRQYNSFKQKYPGALLLFRVGDFYETFGQDAIKAAEILGITLTKRGNGSATEVELAGFPHHALDAYLPKLIRAGQRVAICEQLEDPKLAKGIVKRGVTEVVSPGIVLDDKLVDHKGNNYLCVVHYVNEQRAGAALADVSTGDFFCWAGPVADLEKLLYALRPAEVVVAKKAGSLFDEQFGNAFYNFRFDDWVFELDFAQDQLLQHFNTHSLKGFGIEDLPAGVVAAGVLIYYLRQNEQKQLHQLARIYPFDNQAYVQIDRATASHLELVLPLHHDGRSLFQVLDYTATPMGARLLKRWLLFPERNLEVIDDRLDTVSAFMDAQDVRSGLYANLRAIGDIERMSARLAAAKIAPRELAALRNALERAEAVARWLADAPDDILRERTQRAPNTRAVVDRIHAMLAPEPPAQVANGGVIATGASPELDELRTLQVHAQDLLRAMQQREINRTGIASLKVGFNRVFGYYIEITNTHRDRVPQDYIRKQTLANAERYITEELKQFEDKILTAEERILRIEQELYNQLIEGLQPFVPLLLQAAAFVAELDVLACFAALAEERRYVRPILHHEGQLSIVNGRHPVIETLLPSDRPFTPNDTTLDNAEAQIALITGPNMAGKSAYLRQVALITLMAHVGAYVPADEAHISLVDKIFSRVGASDNLSAGESTFMVEMQETARILNNATSRSLVILDEIGRGTSTFDGVSIAWAIVEYLHQSDSCNPKTLFATHYHELTALAESLPRVRNYHVAVLQTGGKMVFLHKVRPGGSAHSFGIHVAELAGMPREVVLRAHELLHHFEQRAEEGDNAAAGLRIPPPAPKVSQRALFKVDNDLLAQLKLLMGDVDVDRMTPVEALLKLAELKRWFALQTATPVHSLYATSDPLATQVAEPPEDHPFGP